MARIAVLDDYQRVARDFADWDRLQPHAVTFFDRPLGAAAAEALQPFEIIAAMRERTQLPAGLIERLPNLKLIVSTGLRNAAIDVKAAAARGIVVCGTEGQSHPTPELAWTLILALARRLVVEDRNMREGRWQS